MKTLIKNIILKMKMEKFYDLISYFITFYKNRVVSYPLLYNEELKKIKKVLILAPHQDDEIFGMGGTILLLRKYNINTKIIWMTNRDNSVRVKESLNILKYLKINQNLEETFPIKGKHFLIEEGIKIIKSELENYNPELVFLPSIFDCHHDHVRLNLSLKEVLKSSNWDGKIVQYEVWNTLVPNILIDISKVINEKEKLMRFYKSQLNEPKRKYVERILALNKYRGLPYCIDYAEGFILFNNKREYLKIYE